MTDMKRAEPDLILHGRETTAEDPKNYLYLEFKNLNNSDNEGIDTDIKKLQCFTTENGPYGYQLGAHICLDPNYAIIVWFKNGKIENKPLLYPVKEGFSQFSNNNTRIKFLATYSDGEGYSIYDSTLDKTPTCR